tara:strand:+ start:2133 stop:2609 length:477 start_codon:yes stop_codon:yes gene_type:complete
MIGKMTGLFILFSSILLSILMTSNLSFFFDIPSFLIVMTPLLILFFFKFIKEAEKMNGITKGKEVSHWELIGSTSLQLGVLGAFFGLIIMFKSLNNPSAIGPAMAITLLSMFYSLIGFLVSFFMGNFKARPTYYYIAFLQLFFLISAFYTIGLSFKNN